MSLLSGAGWEMAQDLESGQVAMCVRCGDYWLDRSDLFELGNHPTCELCGCAGFKPAFLGHEAKNRSLERRWDREVLAHGWTATPDLLAENLEALGIDESHYLLLRILESFRRKDRDAVWPSIDSLVARTPGWSRSKVERKLRDLRALRLIECEPTRRYGHQAENRITRNGLDAALRRLAQHVTDDGLSDDASCVPSTSLVTEQPVTGESQHVTGDVRSPSLVTGHEADVREAEGGEADVGEAEPATRRATGRAPAISNGRDRA